MSRNSLAPPCISRRGRRMRLYSRRPLGNSRLFGADGKPIAAPSNYLGAAIISVAPIAYLLGKSLTQAIACLVMKSFSSQLKLVLNASPAGLRGVELPPSMVFSKSCCIWNLSQLLFAEGVCIFCTRGIFCMPSLSERLK